MAKSIRSIKADLCDDELLGSCTRDARLLFVGLITRVDDHGRFRASPALVRSRVFPYDDDVTLEYVASLLVELASRGRVLLYDVDGQQYGVLTNWARHQRIDNAARSELPPPAAEVSVALPQAEADPGEPPQTAATRRGSPLEGIGEEKEGSTGRGATGVPDPFPIDDSLRDWARQNVPGIHLEHEAAKLSDWARSKGIRRKDWPATLRNWCRKSHDDRTHGNGQATLRPNLPPAWCAKCGGHADHHTDEHPVEAVA